MIKQFEFDQVVGNFTPKPFPVTMTDAGPAETEPKRCERFLRQVSRCVQACSLCQRGTVLHKIESQNTYFDPHRPSSLTYNHTMIVRWEPKESDFGIDGLFGEEKPMFDDAGLKLEDIHRTTMIKCIGKDELLIKCPFFAMELASIKPGLVIAMDDRAALQAGHGYAPGEFVRCTYDDKSKFNLFAVANPQQLRLILKLVKAAQSNPKISNRLFA